MASIVLGLGTAHTPLATEPSRLWPEHGEWDREYGYAKTTGEPRADIELGPDHLAAQFEEAQQSLGKLGRLLDEVRPDALVVFGDDQDEVFRHKQAMPSFGIYTGSTLRKSPRDRDPNADPALEDQEWFIQGQAGWWPGAETEYPCAPDVAETILTGLVAAGFDMTVIREMPPGVQVGHAFSFLNLRVMREHVVPYVPIFVNTLFPPNQPTAARCYALGKAIAQILQRSDSAGRIALVASGGLSHPFVDEELDRAVLAALAAGDAEALQSLPEATLQRGTSEIKNWLALAGAMSETQLAMNLLAYVPGYRSAYGTGCGMAFATWQ
jgi:3-O-methylgallate 3,4-dioxygenase